VFDLEVAGLFRGQGLDEQVGGLEVGQDGDGDDEIDLAAGDFTPSAKRKFLSIPAT
jgi:hypothetical protein